MVTSCVRKNQIYRLPEAFGLLSASRRLTHTGGRFISNGASMDTPVGKRFGFLVVKEVLPKEQGKRLMVTAVCDCNAGEKVYMLKNLRNGNTKSCGCYHMRRLQEDSLKHGELSDYHVTAEYKAWVDMKGRCYNPNKTGYKHWGGRGIIVCDRWIHSFDNFLIDMGRKPSPEHSLNRLENDGNYEPSNCAWSTRIEQAGNRSNNHNITLNGKTQTLAAWSRDVGIKTHTIAKRISSGWTVQDALSKPLLKNQYDQK